MIKPGNIVLIYMLRSDGNHKLRPAPIIKELPTYTDLLVWEFPHNLTNTLRVTMRFQKKNALALFKPV